jgi:hypothetical protein
MNRSYLWMNAWDCPAFKAMPAIGCKKEMDYPQTINAQRYPYFQISQSKLEAALFGAIFYLKTN